MAVFGLKLRALPRPGISREAVLGIAVASVVAYLLIGPLGMLIFSSFRATKGVLPFETTSYTFSNYVQVFASDLTYRLFWNTLLYSSIALVISLGMALAFAWFIERTNAPARTVLITLILAPLGVPGIVEAMAWIYMANPTNGILNVALRAALNLTASQGPLNIYSIVGIGFVTGLKVMPSAYIMVASVMARLDPALEEASLSSGASGVTTFRRITTALLRPALLGVAVYFGVMTIELFEIPALLGLPNGIFVFSTLIFQAVHPRAGLPDYGLASGYSMVSLIVSGALIYLYHMQVRRQERFAVVTGKGYRPQPVTLRRGWQAVFVTAVMAYAIVFVLLPFLVLVWASLGVLYTPLSLASASLENYARILQRADMLLAVSNTLIVSVVTATATTTLALMTSWLALRSGFRAGWLPDRLTIVAVAMPSVVIGLALIFLYSRLPLPIYGTIWIIIIAQVTRYQAYSARVMNAAYLQIHRELEEASRLSGGAWLATTRWIVLPILWPAIIRGWLWVCVHSLREVTLALMLYSVENITIGVMLWQLLVKESDFTTGAALAAPLMLVSLGLSLFLAKPAMAESQHAGA